MVFGRFGVNSGNVMHLVTKGYKHAHAGVLADWKKARIVRVKLPKQDLVGSSHVHVSFQLSQEKFE